MIFVTGYFWKAASVLAVQNLHAATDVNVAQSTAPVNSVPASGERQQGKTDTVSQQDNITLEREDKFEKPAKHVLIGKDAKGNPQPKIIVTDDDIQLLDYKNQVKKKIVIERDSTKHIQTHIYPDQYDKVIGVHITRGYRPSSESWEKGEYIILNDKGEETLHIKDFNDNTRPLPSPSGDYAIGWPGADTPGGPPIFYDANGYRNKWARGFAGEGWPEGYEVTGVRFSSDGKRVMVLSRNGRNRLMIVYDANGNKLWEKSDVWEAKLSPTNSLFAYGSESSFGLSDSQGKVLWEKNIPGIPVEFSKDEKFLIAGIETSIVVLKTDDGSLLWQWKPEWHYLKGLDLSGNIVETKNRDFYIASIAVTPDFNRTIILGKTVKYVYPHLGKPQRTFDIDKFHIFIFDNKGRILNKKDFRGDRFSSLDVRASISEDGNIVTVSYGTGISYFNLQKEASK